MKSSFLFKCVKQNNTIEYCSLDESLHLTEEQIVLLEQKVQDAFNGKCIDCSISFGKKDCMLVLRPVIKNHEIVEVIGHLIDLSHYHTFKNTIQLLPNIIFKAERDSETGVIRKTFNEGAIAKELGILTEQIIGKSVNDLYPKELIDIMIPAFNRAFAGETVEFLSEYQGRVFNNLVKPVVPGSEIIGYVTEITDHKLAERNLKHLIHHDQLTGLPNRILFHDRLTQAIIQAKRRNTKLFLLMFDLDRFKLVNDSLGHAVGDKLLQSVAKRMEKSLCNGETIARISGDGFAMILENVSDTNNIRTFADNIIENLSCPYLIQGNELYISSSIGISVFPDDGSDYDTLIKNADIALHQAKDRGSNTYQFYTYDMYSKNAKRLKLESDLRKAIDYQQFEVYYQPQMDAKSCQMIGMEALIRWHHPDIGLITPAEFIPVAEETGMIIAIGEWVMKEACKQTKKWHDMGYKPIKISVNLSPKQFQQEKLVESVAQILASTGLEANYLVLEITESISMYNIEFVIRTLEELNKLGIQVSIDDFGTGYSSLLYLKKFPIQSLKIDRSFINDITRDADDAAIALAVIAMAHSLDLKVIAEGVETEEQLQYLKQNSCDNFQGYLMGKPVPANQFEQFFLKKFE
ncbi:hypothetical protein BHU72_02095 [Desulfuribacillus stibiiarsenatis]|uniref:Diguanylate cyclase n=1 Tax=Desulfuribacillus stibiiarsenatis TaxID=1390249 RepID=A0A1E5L6L0_9FIRM|nr:EAL domain-containing protein [Desulfuribacillus stibiiarsenatis]OEH85613.1 hypothetical protein BHU72_02095 [Desulfuribacillus stibiiarsenatis]